MVDNFTHEKLPTVTIFAILTKRMGQRCPEISLINVEQKTNTKTRTQRNTKTKNKSKNKPKPKQTKTGKGCVVVIELIQNFKVYFLSRVLERERKKKRND